jgi:predicted RNA-binding Zn ribbon-like protein
MVVTAAPLLGEPVPVELMNTIWADRGGVYDALSSAAGVEAWLAAIAPRCTITRDVGRGWFRAADRAALATGLCELRDVLRLLAAAATDDPRQPAVTARSRQHAVAVLNRAAAQAPQWAALTWPAGADPSQRMHAEGPLPAALIAEIARDAVDLFAGVQRTQLRACLAPGCVLYFVRDHPRREWCSAACGNRARVARHYQLHRRQP